ncbi:hypothetical protein E2G14_09470 [Salmonella enterica subsp. enterica serovar Reading]|nr:hypothetical protein [Salmonella enterica subsp. enterica serovar Reading]
MLFNPDKPSVVLNSFVLFFVLLVHKEGLAGYYVTKYDASADIDGLRYVSQYSSDLVYGYVGNSIQGYVNCKGENSGSGWDHNPHKWQRFTVVYPEISSNLYRVNENVSLSVEFLDEKWPAGSWHKSYEGGACIAFDSGLVYASEITFNKRFSFIFHVKKRPPDGMVRIPDGLLGYYSEFIGSYPSTSYAPITIPFYIQGAGMIFDAECKWDASDINFDYGILSPGDTRKISAPVGFTCNQDSRVKVRLDTTRGTGDETGVSVDLYDAEGTKTVGQSRVQITSNSVGGNGREVIVTAPTGVKQNFMVSSELDPRGMPAGVFQGSAVLIATLE